MQPFSMYEALSNVLALQQQDYKRTVDQKTYQMMNARFKKECEFMSLRLLQFDPVFDDVENLQMRVLCETSQHLISAEVRHMSTGKLFLVSVRWDTDKVHVVSYDSTIKRKIKDMSEEEKNKKPNVRRARVF